MRDTAWMQGRATAFCVWVVRCVVAATDWLVDGAMARLGESMEWEEVERLAQTRIREESKTLAERLKEWEEITEGSNRARMEIATAGFRAFAEKIDADIMAMGGKPQLRLVKKP